MDNNVNGYVLAGGKSSRMGADKALLSINGTTFIQQIISQIKFINRTTIVSNSALHDDLGYPVICDRIEDIGPLGGIYTALMHSDLDKILIVSCDTPGVSTELLNYLIEKSSDYEATIVSVSGKNHPLLGVYNKSCLPQLKLIIASENYRLQDALLQLNYQTIEITNKEWYSDQLVSNINTPEEYKLVKELWK